MASQQRSAETREALLSSGSRVFAGTPFDKARIADVFEPLSLTQGAFYFHFDNKHDLAAEIVRREHEAMIVVTEAVLAASKDGLLGLRQLAVELGKLIRENITVQAGLRLTAHAPEEFKDYLPESFAIWERTILRFLERASGQGTLIDGLNLNEAASYIVATFMGAQQLSFVVSNWADIEDRVRIAATYAVRSIATEEAIRALDAKRPDEALTRP
jgi:AcrR family transcriptional regulator